jgi:transcription termination factor Rho
MSNLTTGILKLAKNGAGNLLDPAGSNHAIFVPARLIRQHNLPEGVTLTGPIQDVKQGPRLTAIETVCGLSPKAFQQRTTFGNLVAIDPVDRINLSITGDASMRLIDLVAPIGKGTRGLIVAPAKAGKTMLLEKIAKAIKADNPETRLVLLLIDERPEEVTHLRRSIKGAEVFASSSDRPPQEQIALSELLLAHIQAELECGQHVVILVDSLTRLVRAFNLGGVTGRSRTMSGGVDAEALRIPRRFFGLARNIEHGGSVTILATILVDTGSRMDDFIFEEFKGTGNSEIVLDRSLAEAYIFPAINLLASGTRKEERLYDTDTGRKLIRLRRRLSDHPPREALEWLLGLLDEFPTNEELLKSI